METPIVPECARRKESQPSTRFGSMAISLRFTRAATLGRIGSRLGRSPDRSTELPAQPPPGAHRHFGRLAELGEFLRQVRFA